MAGRKSKMVGIGHTCHRTTRKLHEYLAKPEIRAEPNSLMMRANVSAKSELFAEFTKTVAEFDRAGKGCEAAEGRSSLSDEFTAL